jgi:hypothetical protein
VESGKDNLIITIKPYDTVQLTQEMFFNTFKMLKEKDIAHEYVNEIYKFFKDGKIDYNLLIELMKFLDISDEMKGKNIVITLSTNYFLVPSNIEESITSLLNNRFFSDYVIDNTFNALVNSIPNKSIEDFGFMFLILLFYKNILILIAKVQFMYIRELEPCDGLGRNKFRTTFHNDLIYDLGFLYGEGPNPFWDYQEDFVVYVKENIIDILEEYEIPHDFKVEVKRRFLEEFALYY